MKPTSKQPTNNRWTPELLDLLQRGMAGDSSALPEIKRAFDADPQLVAMFGGLVSLAEQEILGLLVGKHLVAREAITRRTADLRARLTAVCSSALERGLVDRVVVCWLAVYAAELELARQRKHSSGASPLVDAALKLLDRAHARYLTAAKTLATVQKLLKPSPSVLDLLATPVTETGAKRTVARRRVAGNPADGVPISN